MRFPLFVGGQFTEDGSKIIYFSSSDRDPGVYYLYDRPRQKLNEIAVLKPLIDPDKMAAMNPVEITDRQCQRVADGKKRSMKPHHHASRLENCLNRNPITRRLAK